MGAEFEVQKALYLALAGIGLTVHDTAPQAADGGSASGWPHVEVGYVSLEAWDTARETGFDFAARIHVRSRSRSMAEAKTIQGLIYDRLHRGALAVAGYNTIDVMRQRSDVQRAADGHFHGVCEYRGLIEKV